MLLYVFGNSGVYYCLLATNINFLIFASRSQQQCSQNYYISHINNRDDHIRKRRKHCFGCVPTLKKKKGKKKSLKVFSFLLGLTHAGILGSIYFTISLRLSPRAGRTKTWWEILLRCQLARGRGGQISPRKDSSQGAHNEEVFQLPGCKSLALPISTAAATGRAAGAQPPRAAQTRQGQSEDGLLDGQTAPFIPHAHVLVTICLIARPKR